MAVNLGSISLISCSFGLPLIPLPTILISAKTLVFDLSITCSLNVIKFLHPAPPQSTTVVTPALKVNPSGGKELKPLLYALLGLVP